MTDQTPDRPTLFSRPLPIVIFVVLAVVLDQII
jgi:signal peptidase II